ncbi:MAG: choice-of-anchor L domain-containing protein, partial [Bacteroidota bacterium]
MRQVLPISILFLGGFLWLGGFQHLSAQVPVVSVQTGSPYSQYVYGIAACGVGMSDVNINCDTNVAVNGPQMSGFMAPGTSVSFSSGLLMTTGSINYGVPNLTFGNGDGLGRPGDPDLLPLLPAGANTNDACIVTFKIRPGCDSVRIRYVFASNEYPNFVSQIDDIFAAFIRGGNYATNTNFAWIPMTTTAVYIGSVNAATNPQYFIAVPNGTAYNSHTVVMEAVAAVDPFQTYDIKLVIADESDQAYDSGVFVESVSCQDPVTILARNNNNPNSSQVVEECVDGYFTVYNYEDTSMSIPLTISMLGTATNGVDYTIPTSATIPAGQDSVNIPVTLIADGAVEGPETITIAVSGIPCIGDDTATLTLLDPFIVDAGSDTAACSEELIQIGGVPDPTVSYNWSGAIGMQGPINSANPSVILSTPFHQTVTYGLTATDQNGCVDTASVRVDYIPLPLADFSLASGVCVNEITTIIFTETPIPGGNYVWDFGPNTSSILGSGQGPYQVSWSTIGPQEVRMYVEDGICTSDTITHTIMVHPIPTANFIATPQLCANEQAQLTYTGSGSATATYNWDLDGGLPALSGSGPHLVSWNIPGTKTITLTVEENGCLSPPVSQVVDVFPLPDASFFAQPSLCEGDIAQITYTGSSPFNASYAWTFGGGTVLSGGGQGPYQVQWPTPGQKDVCLQLQENG